MTDLDSYTVPLSLLVMAAAGQSTCMSTGQARIASPDRDGSRQNRSGIYDGVLESQILRIACIRAVGSNSG
jgi:hypothetical protein